MPIRNSFTAAVVFALASVALLVVGQPVKAVTVSYDSGIAMSKPITSWAAVVDGSTTENRRESIPPLHEQPPTHAIAEQEASGSRITNPVALVDYGHQGIVGSRLIDGLSTPSFAVTALDHLQHDALAMLTDTAKPVVVVNKR